MNVDLHELDEFSPRTSPASRTMVGMASAVIAETGGWRPILPSRTALVTGSRLPGIP